MTTTEPLTEPQKTLVSDHVEMTIRFARQRTTHQPWLRDDAYDAAVDALIQAARGYNPEKGTFQARAKTLIRQTITKKLLQARCRKRSPVGPILSFADDRTPDVSAPTLDRKFNDDEPEFETIVKNLPARMRLVLQLRFQSNHDPEANARRMGLCTRRIRQIQQEAIRRLREIHARPGDQQCPRSPR